MDTTVIALQNLYISLGGNLTDTYENIAGGAAVGNYTIIPDVINAIAKRAETVAENASKTELPAVTASDNGKVLKVAEGKWSVGNDATE